SCSGNPRVWTNTNKVLCITSNTKDVSGIEEVYWSTPLAPDKIISSKTYEVEVEEDSYVYEVYKARVKYNDGKNYLAKVEVRIDKESPTCSFIASSDKLFLSSKDKYSGVKDRKIIKDDVTINFNSTNMAIGNFDGEVTDLAGNITTCSAEVQNTIISKYDIQTQACEQYNLYDCKKAATKIVECPKGYSDTGSKCRKLIGDAKVTMVCPSGYKPSKDRDDCYDKQPFNTDGSALWWCLPPYKKIDDACYHFKSKVPKYSCSSGTLSNKKCYSYEKYISVQYVCSEGTLEDKTCYKYDQMSCDSWKIVTTKKDNYDFFSVVTSDGACSITPKIVCDVDNVGNSYISECTPSEYTCNKGTKIDNKYCLINK
ncbi:MAG: hypothetical protein GX951_00200, partial [Mollicutes bacterium]|nr:hypothetical protein [Mollicutes bacterium]